MADVTKADLDALAARVHRLEQIPVVKMSGEPDNAIHLEHDGGIFVAKGPTQADVDKLASRVHDLEKVPVVRVSAEPGNAIHTSDQDAGIFVAEGAKQSDVDRLAARVDNLETTGNPHERIVEERVRVLEDRLNELERHQTNPPHTEEEG